MGRRNLDMKKTFLFLLFFIISFIVSGCSVYDFPEAYPGAGEGLPLKAGYMSGVWDHVPATTSRFAKSIECRVYGLDTTTKDVQKYYQSEMEKQGWVGEPTTEGYNGDGYIMLEWINSSETAGVRVEYMRRAETLIVNTLVVCVGNP